MGDLGLLLTGAGVRGESGQGGAGEQRSGPHLGPKHLDQLLLVLLGVPLHDVHAGAQQPLEGQGVQDCGVVSVLLIVVLSVLCQ